MQNLAEFIEHARKNPDKVSCGTFGIGSPPHLALEMLNSAAGVKIRHIPYRTFAQTLPDLLSGTLDCSISPPPVPIPYANQGRIRAIAHTGGIADGVVGLPGLESIGKHYPSAAVVGWQAIYARAGTPAPILARLARRGETSSPTRRSSRRSGSRVSSRWATPSTRSKRP